MKSSRLKPGDLIFIKKEKIVSFEIDTDKLFKNQKFFSGFLPEGFYLIIETVNKENFIIFGNNKNYFLNSKFVKEVDIISSF